MRTKANIQHRFWKKKKKKKLKPHSQAWNRAHSKHSPMGERLSRPVGHSLTKHMTRLDEAAAAVQYVTTAWDTYISLIAQDFPHEKTWLTACSRSICWRAVIERPSCALLSKRNIIFGSFHTCICFPTFFYWHGSTTNEDPKGDTSWDYKNTNAYVKHNRPGLFQTRDLPIHILMIEIHQRKCCLRLICM